MFTHLFPSGSNHNARERREVFNGGWFEAPNPMSQSFYLRQQNEAMMQNARVLSQFNWFNQMRALYGPNFTAMQGQMGTMNQMQGRIGQIAQSPTAWRGQMMGFPNRPLLGPMNRFPIGPAGFDQSMQGGPQLSGLSTRAQLIQKYSMAQMQETGHTPYARGPQPGEVPAPHMPGYGPNDGLGRNPDEPQPIFRTIPPDRPSRGVQYAMRAPPPPSRVPGYRTFINGGFLDTTGPVPTFEPLSSITNRVRDRSYVAWNSTQGFDIEHRPFTPSTPGYGPSYARGRIPSYGPATSRNTARNRPSNPSFERLLQMGRELFTGTPAQIRQRLTKLVPPGPDRDMLLGMVDAIRRIPELDAQMTKALQNPGSGDVERIGKEMVEVAEKMFAALTPDILKRIRERMNREGIANVSTRRIENSDYEFVMDFRGDRPSFRFQRQGTESTDTETKAGMDATRKELTDLRSERTSVLKQLEDINAGRKTLQDQMKALAAKTQEDLTALQKQLQEAQESTDEDRVKNLLDAIAKLTKVLKESFADTNKQIDELQRRADLLTKSAQDLDTHARDLEARLKLSPAQYAAQKKTFDAAAKQREQKRKDAATQFTSFDTPPDSTPPANPAQEKKQQEAKNKETGRYLEEGRLDDFVRSLSLLPGFTARLEGRGVVLRYHGWEHTETISSSPSTESVRNNVTAYMQMMKTAVDSAEQNFRNILSEVSLPAGITHEQPDQLSVSFRHRDPSRSFDYARHFDYRSQWNPGESIDSSGRVMWYLPVDPTILREAITRDVAAFAKSVAEPAAPTAEEIAEKERQKQVAEKAKQDVEQMRKEVEQFNSNPNAFAHATLIVQGEPPRVTLTISPTAETPGPSFLVSALQDAFRGTPPDLTGPPYTMNDVTLGRLRMITDNLRFVDPSSGYISPALREFLALPVSRRLARIRFAVSNAYRVHTWSNYNVQIIPEPGQNEALNRTLQERGYSNLRGTDGQSYLALDVGHTLGLPHLLAALQLPNPNLSAVEKQAAENLERLRGEVQRFNAEPNTLARITSLNVSGVPPPGPQGFVFSWEARPGIDRNVVASALHAALGFRDISYYSGNTLPHIPAVHGGFSQEQIQNVMRYLRRTETSTPSAEEKQAQELREELGKLNDDVAKIEEQEKKLPADDAGSAEILDALTKLRKQLLDRIGGLEGRIKEIEERAKKLG